MANWLCLSMYLNLRESESMDTVRTLLEHYWIDKSKEKELYAKVRRGLSDCQKFFREQLGWSVINNERLLKIEKIPAHAEPFMGITEFIDIKDYYILCAVLIYLEDKEEREQFLLSELVDMIELQLKEVMLVDWTMYTQRKSLVRVLQFVENMGMIDVYDGNSEKFQDGTEQEVLYENTGLSRYFATHFSFDISNFESYKNFEEEQIKEAEKDRGHFRVNRVYRQLAAAPALYWSENDNQDSIYLKNQRQWVQKNLGEYLEGELHLHKNAAFFVLEEGSCFGERHPRDAMLCELVLILCGEIEEKVQENIWVKNPDETIRIEKNIFQKQIEDCRKKFGKAWSKEYREMGEEKLYQAVIKYMKSWMMAKEQDDGILLYPAVGKAKGKYPKDFKWEEK